MFIDIHTHVYRIRPVIYPFCTPEELLKRYDEMKVDYAVLLPVVSPEVYFPQAVEDIVEIDTFNELKKIDPLYAI